MIAQPHTIEAAIDRTRREIEDPRGVTGLSKLKAGTKIASHVLSIEAQRRYELLCKLRGL